MAKKRSVWHSQKGQDFERNICRWLSLWLSSGKNPDLLWRSSGSGARATTLQKSGKSLSVHAGDIASIDPASADFCNTFFIECKHVKTLRLDLLVYDLKGELGTMWVKCMEQAASYKKVPLLICLENGKKELVCFPEWFNYWPKDQCLGIFPKRRLCIGALTTLECQKPEHVIQGGKQDAGAYHGRLAPNGPTIGRIPMGVLPVVGGAAVRDPDNSGRPNRRQRLPLV